MRFLLRMLCAVPFVLAAHPVAAGDVSAGKAGFQQFCSTCHGPGGKGDGPAAPGLNPKPADMTDPAWQASVDDEHLRTIIRDGGPAVGMSPMMTPWGHALQDEDLDNVIAYIRSLAE